MIESYIYWKSTLDRDVLLFLNSEVEQDVSITGMRETWLQELYKYPHGYYLVKFSTYLDSEYSDGYLLYNYMVIDDIISIKKENAFGYLNFLFKKHIPNITYSFFKIFRKSWVVSFEYGNWGGTSTKYMYLLKALFIRYFISRYYAEKYVWGKNYSQIYFQ